MYVFDTDTFSNLIIKKRNCPELRARVAQEPAANLHLNAVVVSEIIRLLLPAIDKAWQYGSGKVVPAYQSFEMFLQDIQRFPMVSFDQAAHDEFLKIPEDHRRRHPRDARIAAMARSRGFIVVTSNIRHYENVVRCEDWMHAGENS